MDITKIRIQDLLSPHKWAAFVEGYKKRFQGISLELCQAIVDLSRKDRGKAEELAAEYKVDVNYCEIVLDRASKCPECVKKGACIHCGCSCPENMFAINNTCSKKSW